MRSHILTTLLPHLSPAPHYSCVLTFIPTHHCHPPSHVHVSRCVTLHASWWRRSRTDAQHFCTCHLPLWYCSDTHHAFMWPNTCHVCTCVHPNWVLPTVRQILQDGIHCAVMLHSASYHCPPRSNCKFHFNSTHPDMLAYLPWPVSQNHHSISACHSPCFRSI